MAILKPGLKRLSIPVSNKGYSASNRVQTLLFIADICDTEGTEIGYTVV